MQKIIDFIREIYPNKSFIPLHESKFSGNEKKYLCNCIDTNFVSSVGAYVDEFEQKIASYCGSKYAVAVVNGTCALHIALQICGVKTNDEVIIPALTFVATANAVRYAGAEPLFVDSELETLGICPSTLENFLHENTYVKDGYCYNKNTNRKITACIPMHVFGHSVKINELLKICKEFNLVLIEDAAESLGSLYQGKMTGTFGKVGVYSFNGNKIITCGGGGAIVTDDFELAKLAKHLTTTAKKPHPWEYFHDMQGYNYRLPNVNAALACAQLELIDEFMENKRQTASLYQKFFQQINNIRFLTESDGAKSNYWLNGIIFENKALRDSFLKYSNENNVMTRPIWVLLNKLPMYQNCQTTTLKNALWLEERVVNIPSSVRS